MLNGGDLDDHLWSEGEGGLEHWWEFKNIIKYLWKFITILETLEITVVKNLNFKIKLILTKYENFVVRNSKFIIIFFYN